MEEPANPVMYNVPYFKTADPIEISAFMKAHPFILLCGSFRNGKPVATHIPVLMEERGEKHYLLGHVMKKQEHTRAFAENSQVLAVFSGSHTYVSASWYEHKQVASTWNYQAVHASGALQFLPDEGLLRVITKLTETFEDDHQSPSLVRKMDPAYVSRMMEAIVAFEIEIESIEHVFKLSQNRDEQSYENIIHRLQQKDADAQVIADAMLKRKYPAGHPYPQPDSKKDNDIENF
jgi:transcriptional regulator